MEARREVTEVRQVTPCRVVYGKPISKLLEAIEHEQVTITLIDGDRLQVTAPAGVTPSGTLRGRIRRNRDTILKIVQIQQRLASGEMKINRAPNGPERERLNDHWESLLDQYVALADTPEVQPA